jgi:hypothetical protein
MGCGGWGKVITRGRFPCVDFGIPLAAFAFADLDVDPFFIFGTKPSDERLSFDADVALHPIRGLVAWFFGHKAIYKYFVHTFLQIKRSPPRGHSIWCRGERVLLTTENILKRSISLYTRVWEKQYLIPYIDA